MSRVRKGGFVSGLLKVIEEKVGPHALPTPTETKVHTTEEEDKRLLARREKAVAELISTESTYVSHMVTLDELYVQPLLSGSDKGTLPQKHCETLFYNIRSILDLNKDLLKKLEAEAKEDKIGRLFIDFFPYFQFYKAYIANHVKANRLIQELVSSSGPHSSFRAFHTKACQDPKAKGLTMLSLLITPIQRVPRYRMLLSEIIKSTPDSHPDKKDLEEALSLIEKAAQEINEAVRALESTEELEDIQRTEFDGKLQLVRPGGSRYFLRRGQLKKVCRSADKEYTFFLFSDLLIYASKDWKAKYRLIPIDSNFEIRLQGGLETQVRMRRDTSSTISTISSTESLEREDSVLDTGVNEKREGFTPRSKTLLGKHRRKPSSMSTQASIDFSTTSLSSLSSTASLTISITPLDTSATSSGRIPLTLSLPTTPTATPGGTPKGKSTPKASPAVSPATSPGPSSREVGTPRGEAPGTPKESGTPRSIASRKESLLRAGLQMIPVGKVETPTGRMRSDSTGEEKRLGLPTPTARSRADSLGEEKRPTLLTLPEEAKVSDLAPSPSFLKRGSVSMSYNGGAMSNRAFGWAIINTVKSFVVYAANETERDEWIEDLRECMLNARDRSPGSEADIRPVWVNDKDSDVCQNCSKKFTLTTRRHHCRACCTLICGSCSKGRVYLPTSNGKKVRVCDNCFVQKTGSKIDEMPTPVPKSPSLPSKTGVGASVGTLAGEVSRRASISRSRRASSLTASDSKESLKHVAIAKEGTLRKCGGRVRTWKDRYFVLMNDEFYYYKKKGDKLPAGKLKLDVNTKIWADRDRSSERGYVFCILPAQVSDEADQNRTYSISTTTADERASWITAIEAQIAIPREPWEVLAKCESRSWPGLESPLLGSLEKGDVIQVMKEEDGWVHHSKGWSQIEEIKTTNMRKMVVVRKGFLAQETGQLMSNWKSFFFVLYSHKLTYGPSIQEKDANSVDLSPEAIVEHRHSSKPYSFALLPHPKAKVIVLAASSMEEGTQWMDNLKKVIQDL